MSKIDLLKTATKPLLASALLFFAATPPALAASDDAAIDSVLDTYGLRGLTDEQRVAARALVRRMVAGQSDSHTLSESSKNYMRKLRYKPVHLQVVDSRGTTYLVETDGIQSYATSDLPLGIGTLTFESGEYFAKTNLFGGVSEFIDESGQSQSLLLADWFEVQ